jgi:hypothetical protein
VLDGDLEYGIGGQLVQRDGAAGLLYEQREDVEPASRLPASPITAPPAAWWPAYRMSCGLIIRGPGRLGPSGANTVISGRIRPLLVAARRWITDSAALSAASVTWRRSRTRRLRQYSLPMHRELFRQATRAPKASSSGVCQ